MVLPDGLAILGLLQFAARELMVEISSSFILQTMQALSAYLQQTAQQVHGVIHLDMLSLQKQLQTVM